MMMLAATALAGSLGLGGASAQETVKIGVVGPKTGFMAAGAAVTHWPNFKLWAQEINDRGGLKLKAGQRKIETIEYDDRSQPAEAIKAVERLATQDKVDFIMPVYGTGWNLAVAPVFDKYGYPQVTQAAVTDQIDALIARYPRLFFVQGSTSSFARSAANIMKKLKDEGKIGNRVAIVNVADAFGIELANAGRPIFKDAGFNIVYDRSYPNTSQDFAPIIKAAKAENPDALSPGPIRPIRSASPSRPRSKVSTSRPITARSGSHSPPSARNWAKQQKTCWVPAGSRTTPKFAAITSDTRRSPGLTPTIGGARSTTPSCRCCSRPWRVSARSIAPRSPIT
jgi:hypothetical protein